MLQQCYISGIEKQTFECMGLHLQPLTLGHARLLMQIESPIANNGEEINIDDLFVCCYVCSFKTWEDSEKALRSQKAIEDAQAIAKNVELLADDQRDIFAEYVKYYTAAPMRNDEKKGYPRAPWPWLYAWVLLRDNVVKTQAEAWDTICSDAFAWNACRCAFNNDENLMDDYEVEFYLSD